MHTTYTRMNQLWKHKFHFSYFTNFSGIPLPFLIYQPSSEAPLFLIVVRKFISISFHAICSSHNPYYKMKLLSEPSSVFTILLLSTSFSPYVHTFGTITVNYASKRRTYERNSLFFSLRSVATVHYTLLL